LQYQQLPKIEKKSYCFSGRHWQSLFRRVEREVWACSMLVLNVQNRKVVAYVQNSFGLTCFDVGLGFGSRYGPSEGTGPVRPRRQEGWVE
jgi:hypothetical protein